MESASGVMSWYGCLSPSVHDSSAKSTMKQTKICFCKPVGWFNLVWQCYFIDIFLTVLPTFTM